MTFLSPNAWLIQVMLLEALRCPPKLNDGSREENGKNEDLYLLSG